MKKKKALKLLEEFFEASAGLAFKGTYHPAAHSTLEEDYRIVHAKALKALTK